MTDRVLDISEQPARLSIRNGLLIVESGGVECAAIPCEELAAVVIGHRQVSLTQAVLSELAKAHSKDAWADKGSIYETILYPRYELLQKPLIFFFGHSVSKCPGDVFAVFNTFFEKKIEVGSGAKREVTDHAIRLIN